MKPTKADVPRPLKPSSLDPDIAGSLPAMLRAAKRARRDAAAAGVPIVVWEDGKVVWKQVTEDDLS